MIDVVIEFSKLHFYKKQKKIVKDAKLKLFMFNNFIPEQKN